jgi:hypothetical protein
VKGAPPVLLAPLLIGAALAIAPTAVADAEVSTSTSFTVTPDPGFAGQTSTLHVSVAGVGRGSCGFVRVYDNGNEISGASLDANEQADVPVGNFVTGTHPLQVHFEGCSASPGYLPSDSDVHDYVVNPVPTTTTVAASSNPADSDQTVTITSTTNLQAGSIAPQHGPSGGSVRFYDGSRVLGTSPLSVNAPAGEQAHIDTTLARGTRKITAVFLGAGDWAGSTSGVYKEPVNGIGMTIVLSSSANPSVFGQKAISATVTPTRSTTAALSGRVAFYDGGVTLGSSRVSSTGVAYLPRTLIDVGSHSLTAKYLGNWVFNPSSVSGPPLSQVVQQAASKTTLTSSQNPSTSGTTVTLTATVRARSPGGGYPAGSVRFDDGNVVLGTVSLSSTGTATLSTAALSAGTHSITASYLGSAEYAAGSSSVLQQVVNP